MTLIGVILNYNNLSKNESKGGAIMVDVKYKVKARSESPSKTVVEARDFNITIDEPRDLGGTDAGANPVEYLLAALAGCINVVGYVVANEMGFKLEDMQIELEGNLNPARFMGKSKAERAGYKEIRVKIKVDTDADAETLGKWLEAVEDRCPVGDTLANGTPIKINLA